MKNTQTEKEKHLLELYKKEKSINIKDWKGPFDIKDLELEGKKYRAVVDAFYNDSNIGKRVGLELYSRVHTYILNSTDNLGPHHEKKSQMMHGS